MMGRGHIGPKSSCKVPEVNKSFRDFQYKTFIDFLGLDIANMRILPAKLVKF